MELLWLSEIMIFNTKENSWHKIGTSEVVADIRIVL